MRLTALFVCVIALSSVPTYAAPSEPPRASASIPNSTPGSIDGVGTTARFVTPVGLAFDSKGTLYIADADDKVVRRVTPDRKVTTYAGTPGVSGHADGPRQAALFSSPYGIAIDKNDNLYVTDSYNETVRRVSADGEVTTYAGRAGSAGGFDGPRSSATFDYPTSIAIDEKGVLYVATVDVVRRIDIQGMVTTFVGRSSAGSHSDIYRYSDGSGSAALFDAVQGIASDGRGNLFVSDNGNFVIRKISASGFVTTIAGVPQQRGIRDGEASASLFYAPNGIVCDEKGDLYVADGPRGIVRGISGTVTTILRTGKSLDANDALSVSESVLYANGLAIGPSGDIFVSVALKSTQRLREGAILRLSRSPSGVSTFVGRDVVGNLTLSQLRSVPQSH